MPEPSRIRRRRAGRARSSRPRPIAELLAPVLNRSGLSRSLAHRTVFDAWLGVVPETIAQRTRPLSFRDGVLLVAVDSAPLLAELRCFRSAEFLALLNSALASDPLTEVLVRRVDFRRTA